MSFKPGKTYRAQCVIWDYYWVNVQDQLLAKSWMLKSGSLGSWIPLPFFTVLLFVCCFLETHHVLKPCFLETP